MKINIISRYNVIPSINNNKEFAKQIVFGHYLDYEKSSKKNRLSDLEAAISRVNSRICSDNYDFERESSSLDYDIQSAEDELTASEDRISDLKGRISHRQSYISSLKQDSYRLQNKAEENNKKIKQLEEKKQNVLIQIRKSNEELQKNLNTNLQTTSDRLNSQFKTSVEIIQNGVKNSLIQKVINPILQTTEGKECDIPASVYIEDEAGVAEPCFPWIVKQTDSNYAKLNISNNNQAIALLKKISLLALRSYEENGKRTFTLLEGFENTINSLMNNDKFKDLLASSEKLYHNIIVVISKIPHKEIIGNKSFNTTIKVEKSFATDKQIGLHSLVEFISKHPFYGKNLLSIIK